MTDELKAQPVPAAEGLPSITLRVELEGLPMFSVENAERLENSRRLNDWLNSNQQMRELLDWVWRWQGEGRVTTAATQREREAVYVADPFQ